MDESGIIELQLRRVESAIGETARKSDAAEPCFRHGGRVLLSSSAGTSGQIRYFCALLHLTVSISSYIISRNERQKEKTW